MRAISCKESRDLEREACSRLGIPSICLMENAGAGAAQVGMELLGPAPQLVVCVCGPGLNGGDGFVVARHLAVAGHLPRILVTGGSRDAARPVDAEANRRICTAMGLPMRDASSPATDGVLVSWLRECALVVDALFGTGLSRPLGGEVTRLIDLVGASGRQVLALDVPSGLDCDTGVPLGACVRANVTATFVAPKLGFENPSSRAWTGEVVVVPIGAPANRHAAP